MLLVDQGGVKILNSWSFSPKTREQLVVAGWRFLEVWGWEPYEVVSLLETNSQPFPNKRLCRWLFFYFAWVSLECSFGVVNDPWRITWWLCLSCGVSPAASMQVYFECKDFHVSFCMHTHAVYPSSYNHGSGKWPPLETKVIFQASIFHFRDYGRKGTCPCCFCPASVAELFDAAPVAAQPCSQEFAITKFLWILCWQF